MIGEDVLAQTLSLKVSCLGKLELGLPKTTVPAKAAISASPRIALIFSRQKLSFKRPETSA